MYQPEWKHVRLVKIKQPASKFLVENGILTTAHFNSTKYVHLSTCNHFSSEVMGTINRQISWGLLLYTTIYGM